VQQNQPDKAREGLILPVLAFWEAVVLPLNYARAGEVGAPVTRAQRLGFFNAARHSPKITGIERFSPPVLSSRPHTPVRNKGRLSAFSAP
jgi:hypothetical protein